MRLNRGRLAAELRVRDWTQTALASRARISRATVNCVLCGKSCSTETAEKIAGALGVPVEDLLKTN